MRTARLRSTPRLAPCMVGALLHAWAVIVLAAGSVAASEAQPAISYQRFEGKLSSLEEKLFADAADGDWSDFSLLGAALIASGVEDAREQVSYEKRVADLVGELKRSGAVKGSPREQAQAVLEFLHRRILTGGYHLVCTDLRLAVAEGRFNCVGASVLFNCLASQFGLTTAGLEIPGHAMSRLILAGETLDVETTCPGWFRLLDDPKKQAAAVEKTLGPRLAGRGAHDAREVTPVELVATIYYNCGVDLLAQGRFAEAVSVNAKALRLDPASATAKGNLLATLNNWAITLGGHRRYAEAVERLDQGFALDPAYELFHANYVHVYHEWIEHLCRLRQFEEALEVAARAASVRPEEAYFRRAPLEIRRSWAGSSSGQEKPAQAAFAENDSGREEVTRGEAE